MSSERIVTWGLYSAYAALLSCPQEDAGRDHMAEPSAENIVSSTVYGYPRIGATRQLKRATEAYWAKKTTSEELMAVTAELRADAWNAMKAAGIEEIPSNTFSLYDHMLDMIQLVNAVPARHRNAADTELDRYFA